MSQIVVDEKACIQCGACIRVCAIARVFEMGPDGSHAVRPGDCWGCGQCVAVCPVDAIDHDDFPLEKCTLIDAHRIPSFDQLISLLRMRRSVRTYADQPLTRERVRDLVNAGRWSPTAENSQSVDWIAIDDRVRIAELAVQTLGTLRRYVRLASNPIVRLILPWVLGRENARRASASRGGVERLYERWSSGEDPIFHGAPLLLIAHTPRRHLFGRDDAVYAAYNVMLAAEREDLATCQIGILQLILSRSRKLRRAIGLPDGRRAQVALVVGTPQYEFRRLVPRRQPNLIWNPR
jgi:nitroreductase/NAD-dependent dihydropyrimidine dehydrogenase PreA subunit